MKAKKVLFVILAVFLLVVLSGCSTLSVKAPRGMFVSYGDYNENVRTLGIIQAKSTVFSPLFLFDTNKIHAKLFDKLIKKAENLGADGVTNVRYSWKISPFSYLSVFIASGVFDFYIEGVAIITKN